jgi:hypothetical protein
MTSPVSLPVGHELVASDFDAYENLTGVWQTFSGFQWIGATTNPAIVNGSITARYIQIGKLVIYSGVIVMGSSTTYGTGTWDINLPVTALNSGWSASGFARDNSAGTARQGVGWEASTTTLRPHDVNGDLGAFSATVPFTWATGDRLSWSAMYEAA